MNKTSTGLATKRMKTQQENDSKKRIDTTLTYANTIATQLLHLLSLTTSLTQAGSPSHMITTTVSDVLVAYNLASDWPCTFLQPGCFLGYHCFL